MLAHASAGPNKVLVLGFSSSVASHWEGLISLILNSFNWRLQHFGQTTRWKANWGCKDEKNPMLRLHITSCFWVTGDSYSWGKGVHFKWQIYSMGSLSSQRGTLTHPVAKAAQREGTYEEHPARTKTELGWLPKVSRHIRAQHTSHFFTGLLGYWLNNYFLSLSFFFCSTVRCWQQPTANCLL